MPFKLIITTVVGEGHEGGEVALAVLGNDGEARERAFLAGDVESRVAAVVGQPWVRTGLQEPFDQMRLLCDHCEVEGSLEENERFVMTFSLQAACD